MDTEHDTNNTIDVSGEENADAAHEEAETPPQSDNDTAEASSDTPAAIVPNEKAQELTITKLGHCCLVVDISGVRIMTDPGRFSTDWDRVSSIDIILITHEHEDHLHVTSLKQIIENNPDADIVTNQDVGDILEEEGIDYRLVEHGQHMSLHDVSIEGFGDEHAEIFQTFGQVKNTGYFIADTFFYPGDAFYNPGRQVDVLALPIAGPWMRIKDAISYAREVRPSVAFPVHDAVLSEDGREVYTQVAGKLISDGGVKLRVLPHGEQTTFS